jgi:hypothetical protein
LPLWSQQGTCHLCYDGGRTKRSSLTKSLIASIHGSNTLL